MKKLGLVGGMGPESTMPYYHGIVYGVNARTRKDFFPNLSIESINVFHILQLCAKKEYDRLTDYVLEAIENLARSGADFVALSANTTHIIFDRLQELSPLPLLSIVEAVCSEAMRRHYRKVGLLGTIFTMTEDFYKKPFTREGIEVIVPSAEEMHRVDRLISTELEFGIIKPETLAEFQQIISRMRDEDGIEAIILGCTELPLILNTENSPVAVLDTMKIHIDAIVNEILSN